MPGDADPSASTVPALAREPLELAAIGQPAGCIRLPPAGTGVSASRFGRTRTASASPARPPIIAATAPVPAVAANLRESRQPAVAPAVRALPPPDADTLSALATFGESAVWSTADADALSAIAPITESAVRRAASANDVCAVASVGKPAVRPAANANALPALAAYGKPALWSAADADSMCTVAFRKPAMWPAADNDTVCTFATNFGESAVRHVDPASCHANPCALPAPAGMVRRRKRHRELV